MSHNTNICVPPPPNSSAGVQIPGLCSVCARLVDVGAIVIPQLTQNESHQLNQIADGLIRILQSAEFPSTHTVEIRLGDDDDYGRITLTPTKADQQIV